MSTRQRGSGPGTASTTKGKEIVEGLRELAETLQAGKPLESRFIVRTIPAGLNRG